MPATLYDSATYDDGFLYDVASDCVVYDEPGMEYDAPIEYDACEPPTPVPPVTPLDPEPAPCPPNKGIGWEFDLLRPGLAAKPLYPKIAVSMDMDMTRDVSRSVSGLMLVPEERQKCNFSRDSVKVYLTIDGIRYPMGLFRFSESSSQKSVVKTRKSDDSQDLVHVSLADRMVELKRNTGEAQTLIHGTDPTQVMRQICFDANVPAAIAGSVEAIDNDVTWDGSAEDLTKLRELAQFAGHRPPFTDNNGVIRTVITDTPVATVYPLSQFRPEAESIVVTDNYLSAPNRVIVTDNTYSTAPMRGQWDAPGSAPNSAGQIGYVRTMMVDQAGLGSIAAADKVARQIGEQLIARTMTASITPTNLLDGPVVISYDDALWRITSWSVGTGVGDLMDINATEVITEAEAS